MKPQKFTNKGLREELATPARKPANKRDEYELLLMRAILLSGVRQTIIDDHIAAARAAGVIPDDQPRLDPEYWADVTEMLRASPYFAEYGVTITSLYDIIDFYDKLRAERKELE